MATTKKTASGQDQAPGRLRRILLAAGAGAALAMVALSLAALAAAPAAARESDQTDREQAIQK